MDERSDRIIGADKSPISTVVVVGVMIMQGQGRKGASGWGDGLGVRRSRSVPEQPAPRRGRTGRKEGEDEVSFLSNSGINCGMMIMTRGTKQSSVIYW